MRAAQQSGPTFLAALFGIALDQSPWQYMLSMRRDGYGGVTKVPLGPFGGDYFFLLEPEVLKQALLEDAEQYFPRRFSVPPQRNIATSAVSAKALDSRVSCW